MVYSLLLLFIMFIFPIFIITLMHISREILLNKLEIMFHKLKELPEINKNQYT